MSRAMGAYKNTALLGGVFRVYAYSLMVAFSTSVSFGTIFSASPTMP